MKIIVIMVKFVISLSLISILCAVNVNAADDHCPSSGFIINTLQGNGYNIRASSNSNAVNITTAAGLELQVTIGENIFLVSGNDQGIPLETNCQGNHVGEVEFSKEVAAKQPCESQNFPDGYTATIGIGAHKYHNSQKNWNDARHTCAKDGGHLLVINSDAEENLILEQIRAAQWVDTWLGVHDLFSFRDWVTDYNVPLNETGWATWTPIFDPNPDNAGGNQHCLHLIQQGGMDDDGCHLEKNFVCEIPCDYCSAAHGLNEVSVY